VQETQGAQGVVCGAGEACLIKSLHLKEVRDGHSGKRKRGLGRGSREGKNHEGNFYRKESAAEQKSIWQRVGRESPEVKDIRTKQRRKGGGRNVQSNTKNQ